MVDLYGPPVAVGRAGSESLDQEEDSSVASLVWVAPHARSAFVPNFCQVLFILCFILLVLFLVFYKIETNVAIKNGGSINC